MHRVELPYFQIGECYGGDQERLEDESMKTGGCAAVTACDFCIYLELYRGKKGLYPYDAGNLKRGDYIRFSDIMKPYLSPRHMGIDRLEIYMDGFGSYLKEHGCGSIVMSPFSGSRDVKEAAEVIAAQIDDGFPVPCLTLNHIDPDLSDYDWHWFLLTGYERSEEDFMVKAVTYGEWNWLSLQKLWDTGYERRGGLILYRDETEYNAVKKAESVTVL